jgi:hypothetical protein
MYPRMGRMSAEIVCRICNNGIVACEHRRVQGLRRAKKGEAEASPLADCL